MLDPLKDINAYIENKDNYTINERKAILSEIAKDLQMEKFDYIPIL